MVRLKNVPIEADKVVEYLKQELQMRDIQQGILCRQIVENAAGARSITISPEDIQHEADQFRYSNRLENASQTYEWLDKQLISADDWEDGIYQRLLSKKLAQHLFDQQVETYFAQNKIQYEQAILYRLLVPYQPLAQELFYQIEEEEISFFEAAHLYDTDERRRLACGFEGKLSRWQIKPELSAQVFAAGPRDLIGVIQSESGYELWMPEEFIPAKLTDEIRQQILDTLFQEWLESELNYWVHSQE
ncbi:MAG: peptidylprolyl isomerase [Cyanobacteriota bacterium]|nr:peptidylprolyl isomerase [Cyanobacteriota bacterium]